MARFEVPDGWVAQAYRFVLDPAPAQARALASHAGAARFAHNHMLALVKAVMDQRAAERSHGVDEGDLTPSLGWSLPALRKAWNARKDTVAPWWGENSKEAYNTGLDGLASGQHRVITVETLNASGMRSAGGARKKGLNRALADAAFAEVRRMLAYKTRWYGSTLVEAVCTTCDLVIDRDLNAPISLARLGETHTAQDTVGEQGPADSGSVAGRGATHKTRRAQAVTAGGSEASTRHNTSGVGQTGTAAPQGTAAR